MATYIMLFRLTGKGIENITYSHGRIEAIKETFQAMGTKVKEFYLLLGEYDIAFILEAPNDETVAKATLTIGSLGSVRTETLRAFTEDEYQRIITNLR